ncbi:hypothetical protein ACFSQQ_22450 [Mesorhizobium kowhaii]|uniref:Uncharacterized protein n=1 Tax=Mesorhizobium kowhaii TaxID=1300272 RepID=A0A2W7C879_9HYPH|nr:hypothetical protein B5V02_04825 [Mesorhizobium kowhaii]
MAILAEFLAFRCDLHQKAALRRLADAALGIFIERIDNFEIVARVRLGRVAARAAETDAMRRGTTT